MENLLKEILQELKEFKIETNNRLDNIESDIKDLKQGQQEIKDHIIQLDTKNSDRHLDINKKIDNLSKDFTIVEAVTGKNMTDIAHLKSIK